MSKSFLRSCVSLLAAASMAAATADTVTVIATSPQADEQGLVPGKATFLRNGTTGPLRITYAIHGEAVSSLHGGYLGAIELTNPGSGYLKNSFPVTLSGGLRITPSSQAAVVNALSTGGKITSISVDAFDEGPPPASYIGPGSGYDPASPPAVTISGGGGNGATASSVVTGYVSGLTLVTAGTGLTDTDGPVTVAATGGGGSGATANITVFGGVVTEYTVDNPGINYTAAPTFSVGGGAGSTAASIAGNLDFQVARIDVVSQGTGYTSAPFVTIALPTSAGSRATATAGAPEGSPVNALSITDPGYGYIVPDIQILPALVSPLRNTVARAVIKGGTIDKVVIEDAGLGYPVPTVTITDTSNSVASAKARVVMLDGMITDVHLIDPGSGYTTASNVVVTTSGFGTATFSVTVAAGQITSIAVLTSNALFAHPTASAIDPTLSGSDATFSITMDAVDETANSGKITAVTVTTHGSGFPSPAVPIADGHGSAAVGVATLVGSDYVAPAGSFLAGGILYGYVDFAPGEARKDLVIEPRRNGLGGGRTMQVDLVAAGGLYTVGTQNSATITIADADVQATIAAVLPVAYPTLPTMGNEMPIEMQGRAEWSVDIHDTILSRDVSVVIDGDPTVAPTATDTDCDMVWSTRDILDVSTTSIVVMENPASLTETAPAPGSTTIALQQYARFSVGDAIVFEVPTSVTNGYYRVTGVSPPSAAGNNGTITISPALRVISTHFGTTLVRKFGRFVDADLSGGVTSAIPSRFSVIGTISKLYLWALPKLRGPASPASTSRSVNINLVQGADFRTLSPTSATAVIASDDASLGLRWVSNAGQPNTNGVIQVVASTAFDVDVDVPFIITAEAGATFGSNYSITGVDSGIGSVRLPAGQTSAQIEIQPGAVPLTTAGSITIALLQSVDYLLVPSGTSPVNPTVQVTIAPGLKIAGQPVYLTASLIQDGAEGGLDVKFLVKATDSAGVPLAGNLTSNLGFTYGMSGTATTSADYITPTGSATIPAGSNQTIITIVVNDDTLVEGDETVVMTLNGGPGFQIATNGGNASAVIHENEPVFTVAAGTSPVKGGAHGSFVLTNLYPVSRAINVALALTGTATSGQQYTTITTPVLIPANQTTYTVDVVTIDDGVFDNPGKTIICTVLPDPAPSATYGVATGSNVATLTISDAKSVLSISATVATATEGGTHGQFTVSNSNPTLPNVAVTVAINVSGTATSGTDYTALPASVVIPANTATVTIDVVALADAVIDPGETVVVTLGSGAAYRINPLANTATVTIADVAVVPPGTGGTTVASKPSTSGNGGCGAGALGLILAGAAFGLVGLRRRRRAA